MAREASLIVLVLSAALAGCAADAATPEALATDTPLLAGSPLWHDPQTTPHPAWGWPTLSWPAESEALPPFWEILAPPPETPSIRRMAHVAQAAGVPSGAGIALFGSLAVVPGYTAPTTIVDLAYAPTPSVVASFDDPSRDHRGAGIIAYPDGRLVTVIATDTTIEIYDITTPDAPTHLGRVIPLGGSHKLGVVPGTPIVYNANGVMSGRIDIYDLTDPSAPVRVGSVDDGGCHHIYFWNSAQKQRAICAGYDETRILDTADPRAPRLVSVVPFPHGVKGVAGTGATIASFSHFAILNDDATVLVVGDEMGGSLPPGCTAAARTPLREVSSPTGALWFYDVSDETAPMLLGWYSPGHHLNTQNALVGCAAHHGRLVPDPEGRDLLAMAFYGAGVVLVDFSDPAAARTIDQWLPTTPAPDTWEVWYANGWLVTGDLARGLDVLQIL